jgi:3-deoxy-D-manno-octulosonate 8-phosphate phosphatase (KDO 8-P phosphatase)
MALDPKVTASLQSLEAVAFDVDGTLTDGRITWAPNGQESKTFGFPDIMGISLLRRLGLKMALISGESVPQVDLFAKKLHIPFVAKGIRDKATAFGDFAAEFKVPFQHACFFGDDVNDLFAMEIAGLCACPANAVPEVLDYVAQRAAKGTGFVSQLDGGFGAVRSFADALIAARGLRGRDVFLMRPPDTESK